MLVFNLYCHEQLDALVMLMLVSWHERRLLRRRVHRPLGLRSSLLRGLAITSGRCLLLQARVLLILFELDTLVGARLFCDLPLFVDLCEVSSLFNLN